MKLPAEVKPALWGIVGGAVAAIVIGFTWGGWVTGGTSETRAVDRAEAAVVAARTLICVDSFRHSPDAETNLASLAKIDSYNRYTFIEKGGWATMPGSKESDSTVARACAEVLVP